MAVPVTHVPAAGAGGLLLLVFFLGAFAVVIVVAAVVLALIQAVLPGGDTEADRLHALQSDPPADDPPDDPGEATDSAGKAAPLGR